MRNKAEWDNPMRRQVFSVPELIRTMYPLVEPKARYALTTPEIYSIHKIIIVGSGDSYCAALAAKHVFAEMTSLFVEVVTPMELARHYPTRSMGDFPKNPLVIAISNSGQVTRAVEAITRARQNGAFALAVTSNPDSPLAKASDKVLNMDIPPFEAAPGVRSYAVILMTLYLLAIRIGEVTLRFPMDQANVYRNNLRQLAESLEAALPALDDQALEIAHKYKDCVACEFIGSGPSYATAWYGHEKIYEAVGKFAVHTDTEEWFHVHFFAKDYKNLLSIMMCDKRSASLSRAQELAVRAKAMGKDLVVVSDDTNLFDGDAKLALPDTRYSFFSPFVEFAPSALIAGYLAKLNDEPYSRAFQGAWEKLPGMPSTTNSETIII